MCKGPSLQKTKVISWPHVMVFDCCVTAMLEDMPFTFMWSNKKFVLRSALLGNNLHFIALIRTPEAWLHYDGLNNIKFCFYNLQDTAIARGEYGLDKVLYEVLDEEDTHDFGSTNISLEDILICENKKSSFGSSSSKKHEDVKKIVDFDALRKQAGNIAREFCKTDNIIPQQELSNKRKSQSSATESTPKKRKDEAHLIQNKSSPNNTGKPRSSEKAKRDIKGWSLRPKQRSGMKATCKGCGSKIEYDEVRFLHHFRESIYDKYNAKYQYHCNAKCLLGLSSEARLSFIAKHWTKRDAQKIQQEFQELLKTFKA